MHVSSAVPLINCIACVWWVESQLPLLRAMLKARTHLTAMPVFDHHDFYCGAVGGILKGCSIRIQRRDEVRRIPRFTRFRLSYMSGRWQCSPVDKSVGEVRMGPLIQKYFTDCATRNFGRQLGNNIFPIGISHALSAIQPHDVAQVSSLFPFPFLFLLCAALGYPMLFSNVFLRLSWRSTYDFSSNARLSCARMS